MNSIWTDKVERLDSMKEAVRAFKFYSDDKLITWSRAITAVKDSSRMTRLLEVSPVSFTRVKETEVNVIRPLYAYMEMPLPTNRDDEKNTTVLGRLAEAEFQVDTRLDRRTQEMARHAIGFEWLARIWIAKDTWDRYGDSLHKLMKEIHSRAMTEFPAKKSSDNISFEEYLYTSQMAKLLHQFYDFYKATKATTPTPTASN